MFSKRNLKFAFAMMLGAMPLVSNANNNAATEEVAVLEPVKNSPKVIKEGEYVTIFMGREARNITVDWGEDTNCEFSIEMSNGNGCFETVYTGKAKGKGAVTYTYIRMTVEDLRIKITKGKGVIRNMQTISTKAEDNESYNPI